MTNEEYLFNLWETNPDSFYFVMGYMLRDKLGIPHPDNVPCTCSCTGHGSTPNGYWACNKADGCSCTWIPLQ